MTSASSGLRLSNSRSFATKVTGESPNSIAEAIRAFRFSRSASSATLAHVHTLNGTAVTAHAMLAILENFQEADGSVAVPAVLYEFGAPHRLTGRTSSD